MMTRKELNILFADRGLHVEKFSVKKNGDIEIMRSYFYRHNDTAEKFASRTANALRDSKLTWVRSEDRWAAWPRDSYFVAIFREKA